MLRITMIAAPFIYISIYQDKFPDIFYDGGDPVKAARENWITARRAILRKPIDRIGYGGYLKLALPFPEFVDYAEQVCNEFREL